eukprot:564039-Pyramimonas_sp.AAC.1
MVCVLFKGVRQSSLAAETHHGVEAHAPGVLSQTRCTFTAAGTRGASCRGEGTKSGASAPR